MYMHAILLVTCSAYQLVAIFWLHALLRYRFYVSYFNKLMLLGGIYVMVHLHIYRLSQPGKLCSGDFLDAT